MIEWLGIDHLFELSRTDAIAGFFTPLAIFAAFLLAQLILPARRVPGYVINQETGKPRKCRLNGLLLTTGPGRTSTRTCSFCPAWWGICGRRRHL